MWMNPPATSSTTVDRTGRPIALCASPSIVLTQGLMRPSSPRHSKGPIIMEMVTRIIMCKLPKSCRSRGFSTVLLCPFLLTDVQMHRMEDVNWLNLYRGINLTSVTTPRSFITLREDVQDMMRESGGQSSGIGFEWRERREGGENEGWLW